MHSCHARPRSASVIDALAGPGLDYETLVTSCPPGPGLYAVHGDRATWQELGFGVPPDARPLYVGMAERSLAHRDLRQHFADGRTGSSTLRRSLAALLHDTLGLRAIPRNPQRPADLANYGLSLEDDEALTAWMRSHLRLAAWEATPGAVLATVERAVLPVLRPPLNLQGVATEWSELVRAKRAVMAAEARAWAQGRELPP
jgi:hypothetical protein